VQECDRVPLVCLLLVGACANSGVNVALPTASTSAPVTTAPAKPTRCRDFERASVGEVDIPKPLLEVLGGAHVFRVARSLSIAEKQHVSVLHFEASVDIAGLGGTVAVSRRLSAIVGRVERVETSPFLRLRATRAVSDIALTIDLGPEGIGTLGPTTLADFDCTEKTTAEALTLEEIARWTPAWVPSVIVDAVRGAALANVVLDDRGDVREWRVSMVHDSPDVSTAIDAAATLLGSPLPIVARRARESARSWESPGASWTLRFAEPTGANTWVELRRTDAR
jgi:hypothetical protein